jgi:hypothetical protein
MGAMGAYSCVLFLLLLMVTRCASVGNAPSRKLICPRAPVGLQLYAKPPPSTCDTRSVPGVQYCAVAQQCGVKAHPNMSEIERWQCVGDFMFAPLPRRRNSDDPYFVEHNCYGTGWGNSVRALFTTASLSAVLGRRMIVVNHAFNRMFSPPHPNVAHWYVFR